MSTILNGNFYGVPIEVGALPVLTDTSVVLDIGCGIRDGKNLTALPAKSTGDPTIIRADAYIEPLEQNSGTGKIACDATALPIGNETVDVVITSELTPDNPQFKREFVTDNSPNKIKLMSEIARVVRRGGHWIAYNENISRFEEGHRPPGFVVTYLMQKSVQIASRYMSLPLPFGVYEKIAEPIDPTLIARNADRSQTDQEYVDDYTRAIDKIYPITNIVDEAQTHALKSSETAFLDESAAPFLLRDPEGSTRKFLIKSVQAGRWTPECIPFDYPDPEERLAKLTEPYGNELTMCLSRDPNHSIDSYVRALLQKNKFYAQVVGTKLLIVPRQELLDEFIDFRDTNINESGFQVRRLQSS